MCDRRATTTTHLLYFTPYFKPLIIRGEKEGRKEGREREGFFFFFWPLLGNKKGLFLFTWKSSSVVADAKGPLESLENMIITNSIKGFLAEEIQNSKLLNRWPVMMMMKKKKKKKKKKMMMMMMMMKLFLN
jgi:hypothetical protein